MWNSLGVLFLLITGTLSMGVFRDCDRSMCDTSPLHGNLKGMAPDGEELQMICKPMLDRFACQSTAIEDCTGQTIQELASSENATVAAFSTLLVNLHSISVDLCDENSILHAGYVSSVACFNDMMKAPNPKCHKEGMAIYRAYKDSLKLTDGDERPKDDNADCLVIAYTAACFSMEVREKCGEIAQATLVEVLKRVQFISYSSGSCTSDQLAELRTDYLEFLDLEEEKKTWFSRVFNTRK